VVQDFLDFITARHFFCSEIVVFCEIFISDPQHTLNNHVTVMKFRSDIHKTVNFDVVKVLIKKVGEIGTKHLSESLRMYRHLAFRLY
jgi:hypothetical protein